MKEPDALRRQVEWINERSRKLRSTATEKLLFVALESVIEGQAMICERLDHLVEIANPAGRREGRP